MTRTCTRGFISRFSQYPRKSYMGDRRSADGVDEVQQLILELIQKRAHNLAAVLQLSQIAQEYQSILVRKRYWNAQ